MYIQILKTIESAIFGADFAIKKHEKSEKLKSLLQTKSYDILLVNLHWKRWSMTRV